LNYAYAALESEIRIKAIGEGYDPTIGIMHEGSDGSSKFVFDLMEPERPKVDRAVLDFVKATFSIQRILSFGAMAFVGLTRKWRGWWWRRFRRRIFDPDRPESTYSGPRRPRSWTPQLVS
jgi:hypothetical protein